MPTHERHERLANAIAYNLGLGHPVIVVDSSARAFEPPMPQGATYLHRPGQTFTDKILHALTIIQTPLVAMVADDDFFVPETLREVIEKLSSDQTFSVGLGTIVAFEPASLVVKHFDTCGFVQDDSPLTAETSIRRAEDYMNEYHQILWAVSRRDALALSFEVLREAAPKNDNFIEIVLGSSLPYAGRVFVSKHVFLARELAPRSWGGRTERLHDQSKDSQERDLIRVEAALDARTTKGLTRRAFASYMSHVSRQLEWNRVYRELKPAIVSKRIARALRRRLLFARFNSPFERRLRATLKHTQRVDTGIEMS